MDDLIQFPHARYQFALAEPLQDSQVAGLVALLEQEPPKKTMVLGGRAGINVGEIAGLGRVVVKHYMRGGLLRSLVKRRYVKSGPTRAELELALLKKVRTLGVNAPSPLACAWRGGLIYRAWLFTREVPQHLTLAQLALNQDDRLPACMKELTRQIGILIDNQLLHVDLHPGNVLVDGAGAVYVVDFDKACTFHGHKRRLRDQYLLRWRRAVIKHRLPEELSELFCADLRRIS